MGHNSKARVRLDQNKNSEEGGEEVEMKEITVNCGIYTLVVYSI